MISNRPLTCHRPPRYHTDFHPTNVLYDVQTDSLTIVDADQQCLGAQFLFFLGAYMAMTCQNYRDNQAVPSKWMFLAGSIIYDGFSSHVQIGGYLPYLSGVIRKPCPNYPDDKPQLSSHPMPKRLGESEISSVSKWSLGCFLMLFAWLCFFGDFLFSQWTIYHLGNL